MKQVDDTLVSWIENRWTSPHVPIDAKHVFGVLRIPFDYAVSFRPGARFAPDELVAALNGLSLYCADKRVSLEDVAFQDLGRVTIDHAFDTTYRRIEETVVALPLHIRPVFLGGDHSITDPIFRGLRRRAGSEPLGLIVFDAHLDSRDPVPGKEHSGHWLNTLADVIDYTAVAHLGFSASIYSAHYVNAAESSGVLVRTPYDIRRHGLSNTVQDVLRHVSSSAEAVHISVDIDCIDKAFAPGTSCVSPAGLLPHEVIDAVFEISRTIEVVGFDIVEVSPPLDDHNYTSQLGAQIILNYIAGTVARAEAVRSSPDAAR